MPPIKGVVRLGFCFTLLNLILNVEEPWGAQGRSGSPEQPGELRGVSGSLGKSRQGPRSSDLRGLQGSSGKSRGALGSSGEPSVAPGSSGEPREAKLRGAQGSSGELKEAQGSPGELRGALRLRLNPRFSPISSEMVNFSGNWGKRGSQVPHGAPLDRTFSLVLGCIHYCKGTPCGEAEIAMEGMASSRRSSGYVRGNACTLGRSRSGKPLVWGFPYFRV